MHWLEHKIPPPLVAALAGVAMWFTAQASGGVTDSAPRTAAAVLLALVGLAFDVAGLHAFRRARTTVNPLRPGGASALVVGGVYRATRNPMYVGLALLLLAWTVYLGAPLALLGVAAFVAYITRFQIVSEERVLAQKFGPEFGAYRSRVRRWL